MNIRYLKNIEIDRRKWDDCIRQSVNGIIYGYSWYLDIVCDQWDALVEGDYTMVFPLTYRKKFGINYLYQPCFTQQLGLFSTSTINSITTDKFLENIPEHFKLIEIQLNSFNVPSGLSFQLRMRPNLELELIQSYEEISKGYSQNLKRNLKTARETQWIITDNIDSESIINLFRKNRGKNIETLTELDYKKLISLISVCKARSALHIAGAYTADGVLHGAVVFVKSHQRIILLFSATDETGRASAAMPLLIDTLIKAYSGTSVILDFEGSEDSNLARFYSGFGAKEFKYPFIRRNSLPAYINFIRKHLS